MFEQIESIEHGVALPYSAQLSSLTFAVTGNCAWAALGRHTHTSNQS